MNGYLIVMAIMIMAIVAVLLAITAGDGDRNSADSEIDPQE